MDPVATPAPTSASPPTAPPTVPAGARRLQNAYYAVALFVLVTLILYLGHVVIVPLALSALFAFILTTPSEWLEKRGLPRFASVLIVTIGAFAILATFVSVASGQIRGLAKDLPRYEENVNRKAAPVKRLLDRVQAAQANLQESTSPGAKQSPAEGPAEQPAPVVVKPAEGNALGWIPSLARPLVETFVNGVLIIVLTMFMLAQRESLRDRLIRLAGRSRLSSTTRALGDAADRVGKYLLLQLTINAILGTVVAGGLFLLHVPYAPLWGLLVTVLRFVPYVGYWMAALSAVAMCAAVAPGWTRPLLTLGMFAALDLTMANLVEPLVFSHGTGVSALALLMAAVFWGFLWGPVGLLLSTPLTVCLAVLGKHVPALGFLAILLGDEPSLDLAAKYYGRLLARDYDEAAVLLDEFGAAHPPEQTYDEVILPALAQAKTDREQRDISPDEEQSVYDATCTSLDGLSAPGRAKPAPEAATERLPPVRVVGCAVFGQADDLALRMLADAIEPRGGEVSVARPEQLDDAITRAEHDDNGKPPVVCFSTLSPGGLLQARSLMAAIRRRHPTVKLLVGRWGQSGDRDQTEKFLRSAGADGIGWTLRETIGQLVPGATERAGPNPPPT